MKDQRHHVWAIDREVCLACGLTRQQTIEIGRRWLCDGPEDRVFPAPAQRSKEDA